MSTVTRVHCDVCGKVVPDDGTPYLTVETKRAAIASRADACSEACAVKAAALIGASMEAHERAETAIIPRRAR